MMKSYLIGTTLCGLAYCATSLAAAPPAHRPYRLNGVDLKERVIWGAVCRQADGTGLAFGGQDQDAEGGRPHTRVLMNGEWQAIDRQLRASNRLQRLHDRIWSYRQQARCILARARHTFFQSRPVAEDAESLERGVTARLSQLAKDLASLDSDLPTGIADRYVQGQVRFARRHLLRARNGLLKLNDGVSADALRQLHQVQIQLELAAEAFDSEPPSRAMNCGTPRSPGRRAEPAGNTLVYDPTTKLYVLFGGDHLDYLTNDTWVFDPKKHRWFQRHPDGAPPPRANHRLEVVGNGTIRLTGGYTYSSNPDYVGGQYIDLLDGEWTYDIQLNRWSGGKVVATDSRVYRTGPFHPDFYLAGPEPNAAQFEAWLKNIPANQWVPTNPPHLPRLNRDWGTARFDPDRDMILRWSGGHSAHGGTDVLHFHLTTNRWELPFPVEFPLGQLYSNTSYPNGFNFNRRPWMTGHTYQNYAYDRPGRKMIQVGRPRHVYVYDPDLGDWIGRGKKPAAMRYNGCFFTLTLTATPNGVVCWDKNGRVHRYNHTKGEWAELKLAGDALPGAYVDYSSIAYDSRRDRVLIINALGYGRLFDGHVWALDLKTNTVKRLSPDGRELADRFANVDKCCYVASHDILLMGTYLKEAGDHTPMPAYDCRNNRWITLNVKYSTSKRAGRTTRAFPHGRSDGLLFDSARQLIWGIDTNSHVYVLRLDITRITPQPLQ